MPPTPSTTPPTDVRSSYREEDTEYLSKASYTAASESCVPPSPSAAAAEVARAATDGRVPDHHRPATRIAKHIPAISEFKALVVDEVNEKDLFHGVGLVGRAMGTGHLPLRLVKLPVDDVSKVAVLSWRWDGDLEVHGSKNIAIAVHQAKKMGVRYLFIDLVSIDQCLSGDALIEQVVSFSSLYSTITVIAAYDKDGEYFERTMHRPWISYEARQFLDNPGKVVYVSRNTVLKFIYLSFQLYKTLLEIRRGGFVKTILGVLCYAIGMACISDLKFIIPPYARVFTAAYEKMSRNDYLLTAAILCRVHAPAGIRMLWNIRAMDYNRCSFEEIGDVNDGYLSWTVFHIFLDQIQIGELGRAEGRHGLFYKLDALPHAERVIFTALGMSDSAYREFAAQVETRRACLRTKAHNSLAMWRNPHVISVHL